MTLTAKLTLVDSTMTQTDTLSPGQGLKSEQQQKNTSAKQEKKYTNQEFRARGKEIRKGCTKQN